MTLTAQRNGLAGNCHYSPKHLTVTRPHTEAKPRPWTIFFKIPPCIDKERSSRQVRLQRARGLAGNYPYSSRLLTVTKPIQKLSPGLGLFLKIRPCIDKELFSRQLRLQLKALHSQKERRGEKESKGKASKGKIKGQ